jgi:hypothetical protein
VHRQPCAYTGQAAMCNATSHHAIIMLKQRNKGICVQRKSPPSVYRIIIIFGVFSFLSVHDMERIAE